MITRVVDAAGALIHDCVESGCAVSWDGFTRSTGRRAAGAAKRDLPAHSVAGETATLEAVYDRKPEITWAEGSA